MHVIRTAIASLTLGTLAVGSLNAGVVAHWTFDGFSNGEVVGPLGRIADSSGTGRDGWSLGNTQMAQVSNPFGTSIAMVLTDAADGLAFRAPMSAVDFGQPDITADQSINWDGDWTAEIILNTSQSGVQAGVMHYNAGGAGGEWWLRMETNGTLTFLIQDSTNAVISTTSTTVINDGAWRHIAITHDAVNDQMSLYVNGVLEGTASTATLNGEILSGKDDFLRVGSWNVATSRQLVGLVDQVRISNTVLSPDGFVPEPASIMLLGLGGLAVLRRRRA